MVKRVPTVLAIGGSDSSGGAGVQADLKVFANLEVHGCSVVTCVTAQNTRRVSSIFPLPPGEVDKQIAAVVSDADLGAVKTGMLYSGDIVDVVAKRLRRLDCPIVVDPVMTATVGGRLHADDFVEPLEKKILPLAALVAPNADEAYGLSGVRIRKFEDAKRCARAIRELGAGNVVLKSVPLSGSNKGLDIGELLYDGRSFTRFPGFRFDKLVHGSGCAFSSAIAANLARGLGLKISIERARDLVSEGFMFSYGIGKGLEVLNAHHRTDRFAILKELEKGIEALKGSLRTSMIPEVGLNFGFAVPFASSPEDVCAIRGRLTKEGKIIRSGTVDFGASKHIATVILTAMRFDPEMRSALNLKYDEGIVERAKASGLTVGCFEREKEPRGRSTMEWGVEFVAENRKMVTDIIYDLGSVGKEPMIRVLGMNPEDVLRKFKMLTRVVK